MPKTKGPLQHIAEAADGYAQRGYTQGIHWSLAQICEHLFLAIESTVAMNASHGMPSRWRRLTRWQKWQRVMARRLLLLTGRFPKGIDTPAFIEPTETITQDAALQRLRLAAETFDQKFADPTSTWGTHVLLGPMNRRAWRRFHHVHAGHHFSFLRAQSGNSKQPASAGTRVVG